MDTQTMKKVIADYFKTQPVLKAWLFGSFARGEERPTSDVDILFVPDLSNFHQHSCVVATNERTVDESLPSQF